MLTLEEIHLNHPLPVTYLIPLPHVTVQSVQSETCQAAHGPELQVLTNSGERLPHLLISAGLLSSKQTTERDCVPNPHDTEH